MRVRKRRLPGVIDDFRKLLEEWERFAASGQLNEAASKELELCASEAADVLRDLERLR